MKNAGFFWEKSAWQGTLYCFRRKRTDNIEDCSEFALLDSRSEVFAPEIEKHPAGLLISLNSSPTPMPLTPPWSVFAEIPPPTFLFHSSKHGLNTDMPPTKPLAVGSYFTRNSYRCYGFFANFPTMVSIYISFWDHQTLLPIPDEM